MSYTLENLQWKMRQHANVVQAHDSVHPDRDDCGGVGACLLLTAEHDVETEIVEYLVVAAREGLVVKVSS